MTELEKMLAGELYLASDPQLVSMRQQARALCQSYNSCSDPHGEPGLKILSALFGQIGPRAEIVPPFYCDYGCHIFAEDNVYMNFGCVILDVCEVRIGRNVLFAPYVQVYAAHHPTDPAIRRGGHELGSPVTVGDDVWIGGGVILCPGVTIGSNTTIGAGSVVTRDIPANVVAAGNPCRVIRPVDGEGSGDMMRV